MRIIPLIIPFLVVAPAFAQSRVFTNADLGKPLSRTSAASSARAAAILAPYQFVYVAAPERPWEPTVTVVDSSPTAGPFGEFPESSRPSGLVGSLWTYPQWPTPTYAGWNRYPLRGSGGYLLRGGAGYSLRGGGGDGRRVGHVRPPDHQQRSVPTQTIRRPQPERRAPPAAVAVAGAGAGGGPSRPDRRQPRRD